MQLFNGLPDEVDELETSTENLVVDVEGGDIDPSTESIKNARVEEERRSSKPYHIIAQVTPEGNTYTQIRLHGFLDASGELLLRFHMAKPGDEIELHIDACMMSASFTISILNAIKSTKAKVICVGHWVRGLFATSVLLAGSEVKIGPFSRVIVDNLVHMAYGPVPVAAESLEHKKVRQTKFLEFLMSKNFITKAECDVLITNKKAIALYGKDLHDRLFEGSIQNPPDVKLTDKDPDPKVEVVTSTENWDHIAGFADNDEVIADLAELDELRTELGTMGALTALQNSIECFGFETTKDIYANSREYSLEELLPGVDLSNVEVATEGIVSTILEKIKAFFKKIGEIFSKIFKGNRAVIAKARDLDLELSKIKIEDLAEGIRADFTITDNPFAFITAQTVKARFDLFDDASNEYRNCLSNFKNEKYEVAADKFTNMLKQYGTLAFIRKNKADNMIAKNFVFVYESVEKTKATNLKDLGFSPKLKDRIFTDQCNTLKASNTAMEKNIEELKRQEGVIKTAAKAIKDQGKINELNERLLLIFAASSHIAKTANAIVDTHNDILSLKTRVVDAAKRNTKK